MDSLDKKQPPHVVLDTTVTGVTSETVKSFTAALNLPTVSASFGQEGNIQQWLHLDKKQRNYLLQVMPPIDMIPEVIRPIIEFMNISNAAILHDDLFGMRCLFIHIEQAHLRRIAQKSFTGDVLFTYLSSHGSQI